MWKRLALLCIGTALGFAQPAAIGQAATQPATPPKEIHVDRKCSILLDQSDALADLSPAEIENDHTICHLESVFNSHHLEEALRDGVMQHSRVTIAEQEYLLQNVTATPITFVVEHSLREGWTIDSDPQPVKVVDGKAIFRVNAEPSQIVRLHVGARHEDPVADPE